LDLVVADAASLRSSVATRNPCPAADPVLATLLVRTPMKWICISVYFIM